MASGSGSACGSWRPPAAVRALVDPLGAMPEAVERVQLDADLGFDAPWDRRALEDRAPRLTGITLREASLLWGDLALRAEGAVAIGPDGIPQGRIEMRVENWRRLLGLLRAAGVVGEDAALLTERAMEVLAGLSPDADVLAAPLSFQRGFMSLGPIPLGPARAPRAAPGAPRLAAVGARAARRGVEVEVVAVVPVGLGAQHRAEGARRRGRGSRAGTRPCPRRCQPSSTVMLRPSARPSALMSMARPRPCSLIRAPGRLLRVRQA